MLLKQTCNFELLLYNLLLFLHLTVIKILERNIRNVIVLGDCVFWCCRVEEVNDTEGYLSLMDASNMMPNFFKAYFCSRRVMCSSTWFGNLGTNQRKIISASLSYIHYFMKKVFLLALECVAGWLMTCLFVFRGKQSFYRVFQSVNLQRIFRYSSCANEGNYMPPVRDSLLYNLPCHITQTQSKHHMKTNHSTGATLFFSSRQLCNYCYWFEDL